MENLSEDESSFAWDYGLPSSPLQRRLSVSGGYDYDGYVGSAYSTVERPSRTPMDNLMSASQPVLSSRRINLLRGSSVSPNDAYSYDTGSRRAWEDDDVYGISTHYGASGESALGRDRGVDPSPDKAQENSLGPQSNVPGSMRRVDDLSRAFFADMNKQGREVVERPVDGLAVMYQRSMRKPPALSAQDSVRLRNEARDLAQAEPAATGGFYDISSEVGTGARATRAAEVKASITPVPSMQGNLMMRSANVSWHSGVEAPDANDEESEKSDDEHLSYRETDNIIKAVVAVVQPAEEDGTSGPQVVTSEEPVTNALEARPASLEPSRIYTGTAQLAATPIFRREQPPVPEKKNSSRSSASSGGDYEVDEVLRVSYASGAAQQSSVLEMIRLHFLSGHNAAVVVAATQRCNAVAEDLVATTVSTVYQEARGMGPQFTNAFAVSAYALLPDEKVSNLLPMDEEETTPETIGLASNPISGTVIHNYRPVAVNNEGEAIFLGRAAIRNARVLGFDPYVRADTMMCITVHLKQTRVEPDGVDTSLMSKRGATAKAKNREKAATVRKVYVSTLKVLFIGSNVETLNAVLEQEPEALWPAMRQAFGGLCRTCVAIFVDRDDPVPHAERVLKLAENLRTYENEAPRTGSVNQFLRTVQQTDEDTWSQESVSMSRCREDAEELLKNPNAVPAFCATPGTRGRVRKARRASSDRVHARHGNNTVVSYEQASHVIVLKPLQPLTATEEEVPRALTPPSSEVRLLSPPEMVVLPPSVQTVIVPAKPRQIVVDNSAQLPAKAREEGVADVHVDMPPSVRIRECDARRVEYTRRELQKAKSEQWPTLRLTDSIRNRDSEWHDDASSSRQQRKPQSVASRLRDEWQNSKLEGGRKALPNPDAPFRTVVLMFQDEFTRSQSGKTDADVLVRPTDDTHVLLTMPPQPPSLDSVKCRFEVDEVRSAGSDVASTVELMLSFTSLERLHEAFTVKQLNAAVLAADLTGCIQPFRSQPIWASFHSLLHNVVTLRRRGITVDDALPFKVTLFASVLRGKKLLRDLVAPLCADSTDATGHTDVSALAVNRTLSDGSGGGLRIGVSPLFGALLYETRGIDIEETSLVPSYLRSILDLADAVATDDPEAYVVLTCVQQTAMRLSRTEMTQEEIDQGRFYDAHFSSYTLISTRTRVDMYEMGLQGNPTQYPIHLFDDAFVGKIKTVCVLTIDQDEADPDGIMRAMLMQHKAKTLATTHYKLRKERADMGVPRSPSQSPRTLVHRHNSARAYVNECEKAACALRERVATRELPEAKRAELLNKANTYEQLAQQHMVYLTEPSGYALLTYRATGPGALQVDASRLAEPVAGTRVGSRSPSPSAGPVKRDAAPPVPSRVAIPTPPNGTARELQMPPSPHSTMSTTGSTVTTIPTTAATCPAMNPPSTPSTSTKSTGDRRTEVLSPTSPRLPTKSNSLASTKPPSSHASSEDLPLDGAPRSLVSGDLRLAAEPPRPKSPLPPSVSHAEKKDPRHGAPRADARLTLSREKTPQLTPQRLPAEAGLTNRSIVLFATDVALTKMMCRGDASTEGSTVGVTIAETRHPGEMVMTTEVSGRVVEQQFKFDDIICLSAACEPVTQSNLSDVTGHAGIGMPPWIPAGVNPNTLFRSSVLVAGLQGFLAGSNVSIVLQESAEASKTTLVEQLLRMIVNVCTRERPSEATLFLSMCCVKDEQSTDLLSSRAPPKMVPLELSFSPLAGPLISSAAFRTLETSQDGQDALAQALRAEKSLAAAESGHLLVVTVWQKLVLEAEGDVTLSAITLVAGRGSPSALRNSISSTSRCLRVLFRYVLAGPCYSICGSCITDAEPGETRVGETNTALYMLAYQTSELCNISGKPMAGNSYRDLLRYHKTHIKSTSADIARLDAEIKAIELKEESEGTTAKTQASLSKRRKKLAALTEQWKRFNKMASDEAAVLKSATTSVPKEVQHAVPPFYLAMQK